MINNFHLPKIQILVFHEVEVNPEVNPEDRIKCSDCGKGLQRNFDRHSARKLRKMRIAHKNKCLTMTADMNIKSCD